MEKRKKLKLFGLIGSFCFLLAFIGGTIAIVFAAMQQSVGTAVSVNYVSEQVAGVITASYQLKNNSEVAMEDKDGNTQLVLTGAEGSNIVSNLSPKDTIEFTAENNSVVFKYSFTNTGDADYVATVSQNDDVENLTMEISKDGENYLSIKDYSMVVFNHTSEPENYYVRYTVADLSKNIETTLDFNWHLKSIDKDTAVIVDGEEFESLDDALASESLYSVRSVAEGGNNNYKFVNILKNIELSSIVSVTEDLVIYSQKDIAVTGELDSLFNLQSGSNLLLGLPYDKASITYNCSGNVASGNGYMQLNSSVISRRENYQLGGIIYVDSGMTIIMNDGTLTGGSASYGGAVYVANGGTFEMNGGNISGCNSTLDGGAIYVASGGKLNIQGGIITSNISNQCGGAIYAISGSEVSINGGTISNNTAAKGGGALYSDGATTLNINNATFDSNTNLVGHGGAIYVKSTTTLNITGSTFSNNQTNTDSEKFQTNSFGGALYIDSSVATTNIEDSLFVKNKALNTGARGGGFYASAGTVNIIGNTNIVDNSSVNGGGGFASSGGTTVINLGTQIEEWTGVITGNKDVHGAGIFATGQSTVNQRSGSVGGYYSYDNSEYTGNIAESRGGGVFLYSNAQYNLYGGKITGNTASDDVGGGVNIVMGTFTMTGGEISYNTAGGSGGGVYISSGDNDQKISITGGEISHNTSGGSGGGIYINTPDSLEFGAIRVLNNTASSYGGGIYIAPSNDEDEVVLPTITVDGNTSKNGSGGGIYFNNSSVGLKFTNTSKDKLASITNNTAGSLGGGLYANCAYVNFEPFYEIVYDTHESSGNTVVDILAFYYNASILSNKAGSNGGGAYVYSSSSNQSYWAAVTVNGNESKTSGGGLYLSGGVHNGNSPINAHVLHNTELELKENKAAVSGGGLYLDGATFSCSTNIIENNSLLCSSNSTAMGAGVYANNSSINLLSVKNNYITNKYINDEGNTINHTSTVGYGAGIALVNSTMNNLSLYDNYIEADNSYGGQLYVDKNSSISGFGTVSSQLNKVLAKNGGGIYCEGTLRVAYGLTLTGNMASGDGGGLYAKNATLSLGENNSSSTESIIENNNSTGNGGGLYLNNCTVSKFHRVNILTNNAANGAGIYAIGGSLCVSGATIKGNIASVNGGGMCVSGTSITREGDYRLLIKENLATGDGGGLYLINSAVSGYVSVQINTAVNGGGMYVSCSSGFAPTFAGYLQVESNTATSLGGGIYLTGDTDTLCTLNGSYIFDNSASNGGGIDVRGGSLILNDVRIFSNEATGQDGGAIFVHTGVTLTLTGGTQIDANRVITSNNTDANGGAITAVNCTINVESATIFNNRVEKASGASGTSGLGGAIYACDGAIVNVYNDNALFKNNYVSTNDAAGGNIFIDKASTLNFSAGTMSCDWSSGVQATVGGGIASLGYVYITGGTFSGLRSNYGAAVANFGGTTEFLGTTYNFPGVLSITGNTTFTNCASVQLGDAVASGKDMSIGGNVKFENCKLALGATKITKLLSSDYIYSKLNIVENLTNSVEIVFCQANIKAVAGTYSMENSTSLMEEQYHGTSNAIVTAADGVTLDVTKIIYNKSGYTTTCQDNKIYIVAA